MSQARQYELVYIVSPDATEQDVTDLHAQVEAIVARFKGELQKSENWGRRKLAYRIGKHREGTYVLEVFTGTGEMTKELDRRLKVSDHIIRHLCVRVDEELRLAELYDKTSQAFAVFLPVKSVGVMGDGRRYDDVIALRAVETVDFMTAHWAHLPYEFLDRVSRRIINEVRGISRVVYDISGKPPATIEWE